MINKHIRNENNYPVHLHEQTGFKSCFQDRVFPIAENIPTYNPSVQVSYIQAASGNA
jgi:hypothetical protein